MRYIDFLRVSTLFNGVVGTVLVITTALHFDVNQQQKSWLLILGWWFVCLAFGGIKGKSTAPNKIVEKLISQAKQTQALPNYPPELLMISRLSPAVTITVITIIIGWTVSPLIPACVAGPVLAHTLLWRYQSAAVAAIQARDKTIFFIRDKTVFGSLKLSYITDLFAETAKS